MSPENHSMNNKKDQPPSEIEEEAAAGRLASFQAAGANDNVATTVDATANIIRNVEALSSNTSNDNVELSPTNKNEVITAHDMFDDLAAGEWVWFQTCGKVVSGVESHGLTTEKHFEHLLEDGAYVDLIIKATNNTLSFFTPGVDFIQPTREVVFLNLMMAHPSQQQNHHLFD
jgi:hypothetical protein